MNQKLHSDASTPLLISQLSLTCFNVCYSKVFCPILISYKVFLQFTRLYWRFYDVWLLFGSEPICFDTPFKSVKPEKEPRSSTWSQKSWLQLGWWSLWRCFWWCSTDDHFEKLDLETSRPKKTLFHRSDNRWCKLSSPTVVRRGMCKPLLIIMKDLI